MVPHQTVLAIRKGRDLTAPKRLFSSLDAIENLPQSAPVETSSPPPFRPVQRHAGRHFQSAFLT